MGVTWYLANDMQFYLISPLLVYPLWRWGKYGVLWIVMLTLGSLGGTIDIFITGGYNPTSMLTRLE